jgi:AraC-like DNA-binding protein
LLNAKRPVRVWTHAFDSGQQQQSSTHSCGPVYRIAHRPSVARHDHEHYEISIVISGAAVHETAYGRSRVHCGSVQVVAPGEVHGFYEIDGMQIINCAYLMEWLLCDLRELLVEEGLVPLFLHTALFSKINRIRVPQWTISDDVLEMCLRELRDIAAECEQEKPCLIYMNWCLKKLMMTLGRSFAVHDGEVLLPIQSDVQRALQRVEESISQGEPLNVASLAESLSMSPDYFSRVFKEATGYSPMDYFQRRRVQQACWLLLNSSQSVTRVAHNLGYSDSAHFSHLFKRYRGMSARDFRRKYSA